MCERERERERERARERERTHYCVLGPRFERERQSERQRETEHSIARHKYAANVLLMCC